MTLLSWNFLDSIVELRELAEEGDEESAEFLESLIAWSKELHENRAPYRRRMTNGDRRADIPKLIDKACGKIDTPPNPKRRSR